MKPAPAKTTLTPKLRFPEFRDAPGWADGPLKQFAHVNPSADELPDSFIYIDLESVEAGELKARNKISRQGAPSRAQRLLKDGDVIYQTVRPYQKNNLFCVCEETEDYVASTGYAQLRARQSDKFLYHAVHSDGFVSAVMAKCTGSNYPAINSSDLAEINIAVPPSLAEQHRIASCLSSLDDLIAAERQKLDALKAHKKGLMQHLFPREGETRPRLRFPEFQNAGEWMNEPMGTVFEITSGGTPSRSVKGYWGGPIPWITTSLVNFRVITEADESITEDGLNNSSAKIFPQGTVLIAMYGQGKTRGQSALLGIESATNQACAAILPRKGVDPYFVFLSLAGRYEELRDLSNAGGQENLSQGLIKGFPFSYPADGEEQRRITSCLSSLDDLIAAQSDKLEAIKTHKKGLMQQLFPAPEEVGA